MSIKIYDKAKIFGKTKVVAGEQINGVTNIVFGEGPFDYEPVLNISECLLLADSGPGGGFYGATITLTTNAGNVYKFGYTYEGTDWIVRRDEATGVSVAVVYMYSGGKPNDVQTFTLSDSTFMRWGTDVAIPWSELTLADSYYTSDNMLKVPGYSYPE